MLLVHAFLADDISSQQREALEERLREDARVLELQYVDAELARERFERLFPDETLLLDSLETNPLPASFEIRLSSQRAPTRAEVERFIEDLEAAEGIQAVRYDRQWVQTLEAIGAGITFAGAVLGGLLLLAAVVTASNIVKINVYSRREEIEIMRLVGADGIYVRGPFFVVGLVQGLLASLLSLLVLLLLFFLASGFLQSLQIQFLGGAGLRFFSLEILAGFVLGGPAVGLLASLLSFGRAGRT